MITVKTVDWCGGACPYQIEGMTDDSQYFYLRYRMGRLRAGVAETSNRFWNNPKPYNIIDIDTGDEYDGIASHDKLSPLLEGKIQFPDGFKIESENSILPE
jgi:hypothetical protein